MNIRAYLFQQLQVFELKWAARRHSPSVLVLAERTGQVKPPDRGNRKVDFVKAAPRPRLRKCISASFVYSR